LLYERIFFYTIKIKNMTNKTKQIEMLNRALNLPCTEQEDFYYSSDVYEIAAVYLQIKGYFTKDKESKFVLQYLVDFKTEGVNEYLTTETYPTAIDAVSKIQELIDAAETVNNIMGEVSEVLF
jgi:hypothetical protein